MASKTRKTPKNTQEFVDYRIGEAETKIDNVKTTVDEIREKLDTNFATKDYVESRARSIIERLESLENDRVWFIRTVLGFVILGVLAVVITFNGK